jgi:hypothetical protein
MGHSGWTRKVFEAERLPRRICEHPKGRYLIGSAGKLRSTQIEHEPFALLDVRNRVVLVATCTDRFRSASWTGMVVTSGPVLNKAAALVSKLPEAVKNYL